MTLGRRPPSLTCINHGGDPHLGVPPAPSAEDLSINTWQAARQPERDERSQFEPNHHVVSSRFSGGTRASVNDGDLQGLMSRPDVGLLERPTRNHTVPDAHGAG